MKKLVVFILLLALTLFAYSTDNQMINNSADFGYSSDVVVYTDYETDDIYIEFPQIKGLSDQEVEQTVNSIIKERFLDDFVYATKERYPTLKLITNMQCQITLQTDDLFSFVVLGSVYVDTGLHPEYRISAMTFNLTDGKQLELSDFVEIDENFIGSIKSQDRATSIPILNGTLPSTEEEQLMEVIRSDDDEMLLEAFQENWSGYGFYLTPDSLGLIILTYHASGDVAVVELPGTYTNRGNLKNTSEGN